MEQPARVRRYRLQVAPLGLGVHRAERQRRLARPGHTREHHEGVARNVDVDVLQIVLAGSADSDENVACRHRGTSRPFGPALHRARYTPCGAWRAGTWTSVRRL